MYISSYESLKKIDLFISKNISNVKNENNKKIIDEFKILLSCFLFDLDSAQLKNYLTNEYFLQSIKIKNNTLTNYFNKYDCINNNKIFEIIRDELCIKDININKLIDDYIKFLKNSNSSIELLSEGKCNFIKNELYENGYIILENIFDIDFLNRIKKSILQQTLLEKSKGKSHIYGNGKLQRVWNLPVKIKGIDEIIFNKKIITILETFFDRKTFHQKYFLSSFQANILYDGAEESIWHRDDNIPDPHPGWPIKLNFMVPLDDINNENGSTEFIIKSHKNNLKLQNSDILNGDKFTLNLKMGSLASWTGKLWHRSTRNNSGKPRVVLLIMFVASYIKEASNEEQYNSKLYSLENIKNKKLFRAIIGAEHGKRKGIIE
jgi:ectoine hydroxylase-related dioxygenase (phytanoyl-CoA dioxygenase family)